LLLSSIKSKREAAVFNGAVGSLSERAIELQMADVLALPAIVLRNDQQDALGVGLGVTEYAPHGKSAEEIHELWRWVWARLHPLTQTELATLNNHPTDAMRSSFTSPAHALAGSQLEALSPS
jgi:chromosome partitioning protein